MLNPNDLEWLSDSDMEHHTASLWQLTFLLKEQLLTVTSVNEKYDLAKIQIQFKFGVD